MIRALKKSGVARILRMTFVKILKGVERVRNSSAFQLGDEIEHMTYFHIRATSHTLFLSLDGRRWAARVSETGECNSRYWPAILG